MNSSDRTATPPGPLRGFRVLELTTTVAGPFCGRLLADFGAEVIKVEPPAGDDVRAMGLRSGGHSLYAGSILRNKRLVALDLRRSEAQDVVRRLAAGCDLVIENFRPGRLEEWGLGYETLSAARPALVMVRISGYGQTGPARERPGYGVIMEAVGGLRELTGDPDRPPSRISISLTDYITGLYAAFGAVMALHQARASGHGQVIDAALYEGAFSFMEMHVPAFAALGVVPTRTGTRLPNNVPNNLYGTADGRHLLIAAPAQANFRRLCEVMGKPALADDPRFRTPADRAVHEDALDVEIADWAGALPLDEAEEALHAAAIPATRVLTLADIYAHPHYRARGMLAELPHDGLGRITVPAVVPRLSGTPGSLRWAGRRIGADTRAVLTELAGLGGEDVDALVAAGVAACADVSGADGAPVATAGP